MVLWKLNFRQEHRRDAPAVPVLAQTPRAGFAEIRRGGQMIFRTAKMARSFPWD